MKKKVEIKNKEKQTKNENIDMEKVSFLEAGSTILIQPDVEDGDAKEEIAQFPDKVVSSEIKKVLIESLKNVDDIMKKTNGGESIKLKKKDRKEISQSLQNNVEQVVDRQSDEYVQEYDEDREH